MNKNKMTDLIEAMVAEIVEKSDGTFDPSGARALLGAQLRRQKDALITAALPNMAPPVAA